jgi:hypothetical protein
MSNLGVLQGNCTSINNKMQFSYVTAIERLYFPKTIRDEKNQSHKLDSTSNFNICID